MIKTYLISLAVSQSIFFLLLPLWLSLTAYLHPIVIAVVWFCVTALAALLLFLWKKQVMVVPQKLFHACLILYTVGLLILLFIRPDSGGNSYNLVPFYTISYYFSGQVSPIIAVYNLAANIGLFIPYGIFLKSRAASMRKTFAYSVFVIAAVEIAQFAANRGSLDMDDLILNVFGIFAGYAFFPIFSKAVYVKEN
ncbi:VanZ family protein [Metabacillus hrfriensis]|uniref:VanZ family protein n=1 Tax=Metabacillus hrfriensis TaxID=3048891 RepID=A0ACD4R7K9_9BACI|nr:VanZ family protein [Metabacillus sp. CT-WN-B3]USK27182.1 VanZ family protein [Bacillus sp. CMF21]WHZ56404.1 VanZ family protein [Metabacillus sp. CT-WN-B3]